MALYSPALVRPFAARCALMGDSITAYNTQSSATELSNGLSGYLTHLNWISGQRFTLAYDKGVSGNTTSQMLARYAADIQANYANFDILFLLGGTNDLVYGQSGPTVSYPRSISKETTLSNLQAMASDALANGKIVVLLLIYPRAGTGWNPISDGASQVLLFKEMRWINQRLRLWHRDMALKGVPLFLVDPTRDISDPTNANGTADLTLLTDGLHTNGYGTYRVATRIWNELQWAFPRVLPILPSADDPYDATYNPYGNLIGASNPMFRTTSGGTATRVDGTVPASWVVTRANVSGVSSEVVVSTSAFSAGYDASPGKGLVLTVAMANTYTANEIVQVQSASCQGNVSQGDSIYASCKVSWTGAANFNGARLVLQDTVSGVTFLSGDGTAQNGYGIVDGSGSIVMKTRSRIMGASVTTLNSILQLGFKADAGSPAAVITVSDWQIRKDN